MQGLSGFQRIGQKLTLDPHHSHGSPNASHQSDALYFHTKLSGEHKTYHARVYFNIRAIEVGERLPIK